MGHITRQPSVLTILMLLLVTTALAGCSGGQTGSGTAAIPAAPAVTLKSLDGTSVSLANYKGKVVIVDFWATWCGPCKVAIPDLISLSDQYRDQGVEVIGVTVNSGTSEEIKAFAEEQKMNYTLVFSDQTSLEAFGRVMSPPRARVSSFPTTFVIDRSGNVYKSYIGYRGDISRAELEADIKKLL